MAGINFDITANETPFMKSFDHVMSSIKEVSNLIEKISFVPRGVELKGFDDQVKTLCGNLDGYFNTVREQFYGLLSTIDKVKSDIADVKVTSNNQGEYEKALGMIDEIESSLEQQITFIENEQAAYNALSTSITGSTNARQTASNVTNAEIASANQAITSTQHQIAAQEDLAEATQKARQATEEIISTIKDGNANIKGNDELLDIFQGLYDVLISVDEKLSSINLNISGIGNTAREEIGSIKSEVVDLGTDIGESESFSEGLQKEIDALEERKDRWKKVLEEWADNTEHSTWSERIQNEFDRLTQEIEKKKKELETIVGSGLNLNNSNTSSRNGVIGQIFDVKDFDGNTIKIFAKSFEEAQKEVIGLEDQLYKLKGTIQDVQEYIKNNPDQTSPEIEKAISVYNRLEEKLKDVKSVSDMMLKGQFEGKGFVNEGILGNIDKLHKAGQEIQSAVEKQKEVKKETQETNNAFVSLRTRIQEARQEVSRLLDEGKQNTKEFAEAVKKASDLEEQMKQVNLEIEYGKNGGTFAAIKDGLQGIAGVGSLAAGVIGLFNKNNEEMIAIQTKIQSLLGIVVGLQQSYTFATKAATIATKVFNTVVKSGPIGWIATAIGAAVSAFAIYKSAVGEATDKTEEFNNELKSHSGTVAEAQVKIQNLQSEWNKLTSDKERKEWVKENKDEFKDLGIEIDNVQDAERLLVQKTDTVIQALNLRAKAAAYAALATKKYQEALENREAAGSRRKNLTTGDYFSGILNVGWDFNFGESIQQQANKAANELVKASYGLEGAAEDYVKEGQKLNEEADNLIKNAGFKLESSGKEKEKAKKTNKDKSKELANAYAKEIAERLKHSEDVIKLEREAKRAQEDAEIAGIRNTAERERRERETQYNRTMEDLKRQEDEIYKKIYDQRKKTYENANKGKKYENTSEGKAGWQSEKARLAMTKSFTDEEKKLFDTNEKYYSEKRKKANEEYLRLIEQRYDAEMQASRDFLKKWGDFEQQKLAITEEYEEKIRKASSPTEAASLTLQREDELKKLEKENLLDKIDWSGVFSDLQGHTQEYLIGLRDQLQKILDAGNLPVDQMATIQEKLREINGEISKQNGLFQFQGDRSREHTRLLKAEKDARERVSKLQKEQLENEEKLAEAEKSVRNYLASLGIDSDVDLEDGLLSQLDPKSEEYKQAKKLLTDLKVSEGNLAKSRKETEKATNDAKRAEDAAKRESAQAIADWFSDAQQFIAEKGLDQLPDLFNEIGLKTVGEKVSKGFSAFNNAAGAAADFASGNYVGAALKAISAVKDVVGIFGGSSNAQAMLDIQEEMTDKMEANTYAIEKMTEALEKSYGGEAIKNAQEVEKRLVDNMNSVVKGIDAALSSDYGGRHSDYYHLNKNQDVLRQILDYGKDMGITAWNGSGYAWQELINQNDPKKLAELFEKIRLNDAELWRLITKESGYNDGKLEEWLEKLMDTYDQFDENVKALNEQLTTTTEENVFSDFMSSLYDLADGSEDVFENVASNWQKMVNQMVINNVLGKDVREWVKGWYEQLAQLQKDYEGNYESEDYKSKLQALYDSYEAEMESRYGKIQQLTEDGIIKPVSEVRKEYKKYFEDLKSSWESTLTDMSDTTKDWKKTLIDQVFSDLVESTILDAPFVTMIDGAEKEFKDFEAYLKDWSNRYKAIIEDTTLTDEERNRRLLELVNEQAAIRDDLSKKSTELAASIGKDMTEAFSNSIDNLGSTLLDALLDTEKDAEDMGREIAMNLIKEMLTEMLASEKYADRIKAIKQMWQNILKGEDTEHTIDDVMKEITALNEDMSNDEGITALAKKYEELEKAAKKTESSIGDLKSSFMDAMTDMENGTENFKKKLNDTLVKDLIEKKAFEIPITVTIDDKEETFDNFELYQKNWTERYNKIYNNTELSAEERERLLQALVDELIAQEKILAEGTEDLAKRLNQDTTFTSMESSFVSALMDMDTDIEDFAQNMKKTIIQKLVESFMVSEQIKPYLDELQKTFDYIMNPKNDLSMEQRLEMMTKGFVDEAGNKYLGTDTVVEVMTPLNEFVNNLMTNAGFVSNSMKTLGDSLVSFLTSSGTSAEDFTDNLVKEISNDMVEAYVTSKKLYDELARLKQNLADALKDGDQAAIDAAKKDITDFVNETKKGLKNITSVFDELENDTTFSGMAESWANSLMDMSKTAEDWSKDIGQTMANRIIQQMIVPTMLQPLFDNLQKVFEGVMKANTSTDEEGNVSYDWKAVLNSDELKNEITKVTDGSVEAQKAIKMILEAFGLDTSKYEGFSGLGDSILNSLASAEGSIKDWAADMGRQMAEQMAQAYIDKNYQGEIDKLNEDWQKALDEGDEGAMKKIEADLEALYQKMGDDPRLQAFVDKFKEIPENPFDGLRDSFVSTLLDMESDAEDFANNIATTLLEKMVDKTIKDQFQTEIDGLEKDLANALAAGDTALIENLTQRITELGERMGEAVQPLLDAIKKINAKTDTTFTSMRDSWVSALMDMDGTAEQFAENVGRTMAQKILAEMVAPIYIQPLLEKMKESFNALIDAGASYSQVVAAMSPYLDEIENVYNQIIPIRDEIFTGFSIYQDTVEEAVEEVKYALQDMKSNFVSSLMDMESSTEDFSKSISQAMAQNFIENFVLGQKFDQQMEYWQRQYEGIISSGMSDTERKRQLKALRDTIASAKEGYVEEARAIQELLGLTTGHEDKTASVNVADKVTYDQMDEFTGILRAIQIAGEQRNDLIRDIRTQMGINTLVGATGDASTANAIMTTLSNMSQATSSGGSMEVKEIRNMMIYTNQYLLDIQKSNRSIYNDFGYKMDKIIDKLDDIS